MGDGMVDASDVEEEKAQRPVGAVDRCLFTKDSFFRNVRRLFMSSRRSLIKIFSIRKGHNARCAEFSMIHLRDLQPYRYRKV